MAFDFPFPPELDDPILGFRFAVVFLGSFGKQYLPTHPLDFRFQSVEGLSQGVELAPRSSNAVRAYPNKLVEGELTLTRGMPLISTLRMEVNKSFKEFQFKPRNVMVSILDENMIPVSNWLFREAYPIEWTLSGLDASASEVIIESMKLTYTSVKSFSL